MKRKFFLSFIIVFISFSLSYQIIAQNISLVPSNETTFEGGINTGTTVQIIIDVDNLWSTYFAGTFRPAEVYLDIDGAQVYEWDAWLIQDDHYSVHNIYMDQGTHTIRVRTKCFDIDGVFPFQWLDVTEKSKTNTIYINSPPTLTIDNNFTDQSGTTHGVVTVSGYGTQNAPFTFQKNSGLSVTLTAVSPQTDNQGYQVIWNTSGTNDS
jgi:hypothetical protein